MSKIRAISFGCFVIAALSACNEKVPAASASPPRATKQVVVALDLSGSQTNGKRAAAQETLSRIINELDYGDRVVLLRVSESAPGEDSSVRWEGTAPSIVGAQENSLDKEGLVRFKESATRVAKRIFADTAAGKLKSTDILSTLYVASEYMSDAGNRRPILILLSDMLQSAGGVNMETTKGIPSAQWVNNEKAAGRIHSLANACVGVVGAESATIRGMAVRDFWQRYFTQAGADLQNDNYRMLPSTVAIPHCK
jgi:hypothetical protein